jgi:hypothetical protein
MISLESFYVARAGFGEAFDGFLDPAGDALVEIGHVTQSRLRPFDLHYSISTTLSPIPYLHYPIFTNSGPTCAWLRREEYPCRRCSGARFWLR